MRSWTFGSLFAGIGGIDLGLERTGWSCRWQVEIDPYCLAVLRKHWPNVPKFGDVKALTGEELEQVDLICGGFPCQPVSVAGKRKAQADERWLWPEFARIIRVVRPQFVLVENVPGILSANEGKAMGEVLGDLAANGYDAEWNRVSAASVGAPHRRERIFIVGYNSDSDGCSWRTQKREIPSRQNTNINRISEPIMANYKSESDNDGNPRSSEKEITQTSLGRLVCFSSANPNKPRLQGCGVFRERPREGVAWSRLEKETISEVAADLCGVDDGVPARVDRLKCLGNAVVPQVAEYVGRRILAMMEAVKN